MGACKALSCLIVASLTLLFDDIVLATEKLEELEEEGGLEGMEGGLEGLEGHNGDKVDGVDGVEADRGESNAGTGPLAL